MVATNRRRFLMATVGLLYEPVTIVLLPHDDTRLVYYQITSPVAGRQQIVTWAALFLLLRATARARIWSRVPMPHMPEYVRTQIGYFQ